MEEFGAVSLRWECGGLEDEVEVDSGGLDSIGSGVEASFDLRAENPSELQYKSNGLICLVEEISRQGKAQWCLFVNSTANMEQNDRKL